MKFKLYRNDCNNILHKLPENSIDLVLVEDTVLDFAFGSGTTAIACKKENRNFIGIEKDLDYFKLAKKRIKES